jgi:hypothetical protein
VPSGAQAVPRRRDPILVLPCARHRASVPAPRVHPKLRPHT